MWFVCLFVFWCSLDQSSRSSFLSWRSVTFWELQSLGSFTDRESLECPLPPLPELKSCIHLWSGQAQLWINPPCCKKLYAYRFFFRFQGCYKIYSGKARRGHFSYPSPLVWNHSLQLKSPSFYGQSQHWVNLSICWLSYFFNFFF